MGPIILLLLPLLTLVECHKKSLPEILKKYSNVPVNCIWRKRVYPSGSHPFHLFHQRKAGGSSLRTSLNNAADKLHLSRFIPMLNGVPGTTFEIPPKKRYAITAGHFSWSSSISVLSHNSSLAANDPLCYRDDFSCLTNFREPISRIESCIYERYTNIFKKYNGSCITDIPIEDFAIINIQFRRYNNMYSCLNEPFRMFLTDDEIVLNSLGFVHNNDTGSVIPHLGVAELSALETTMNHLAKCVPLVLEIPESRDRLRLPFPVLYENGAFEDIVVNSAKHGRECARVSGQHLELLKNMSSFEKVVYDAVVGKVRRAIGAKLLR